MVTHIYVRGSHNVTRMYARRNIKNAETKHWQYERKRQNVYRAGTQRNILIEKTDSQSDSSNAMAEAIMVSHVNGRE